VAARSKACVWGRSLAGNAVRIPPGMTVSCKCCEFCLVEVSAIGRSLVQTSPTECGVSECDREASTMTRPTPTMAVEPLKKVYQYVDSDMLPLLSFNAPRVDVNSSKRSATSTEVILALKCDINTITGSQNFRPSTTHLTAKTSVPVYLWAWTHGSKNLGPHGAQYLPGKPTVFTLVYTRYCFLKCLQQNCSTPAAHYVNTKLIFVSLTEHY
jgi:hypothetical protein